MSGSTATWPRINHVSGKTAPITFTFSMKVVVGKNFSSPLSSVGPTYICLGHCLAFKILSFFFPFSCFSAHTFCCIVLLQGGVTYVKIS